MTDLTFALIRHGDYQQRDNMPSAHQPWPLTTEGQAQAVVGAARLLDMATMLGLPLNDCWYSSPLARARETAEIMRAELQVSGPLVCCDDLMERGLGSANNLSIDEVEMCLSDLGLFEDTPVDWKANSEFRLPLPGAESLMDAGQRVAQRLLTIAANSENRQTLVPVFGHGAAFRHAAYHLGVLDGKDIRRFSMHHALPVVIAQSADGKWTQRAGEWKERTRQTDFTD